jgi:hypothetical protein
LARWGEFEAKVRQKRRNFAVTLFFEVLGDAAQAPAFGAQFEKLTLGIGAVHIVSFYVVCRDDGHNLRYFAARVVVRMEGGFSEKQGANEKKRASLRRTC